jgi:hypothetical protein
MKNCLIAICLLWTVGMAPAFDYQIKTVQVMPIESYPAKVSIGAVTIAADPYPNDDKSFTAFDIKDLNSKGYFPVHVIIQNSSPNFITLKIRNVVLVTEGGQELYTTSATLVVQDVVKGGLISKLPKMKSHDQATSTKTGSPLLDFTAKELSNRQIEPGTVSAGFIFFFSPEPKKPFFNGSTLMIPQLIDEGSRKTLGPFTIPLDPALEPLKAKGR